jgi:hypothetical protein
MCPCRTVRSEPRTVGVSPAQDASLRAEANRVMSPISASRTSAVNGPTPGSWVKIVTRGSLLAWLRTDDLLRLGLHRLPISEFPCSAAWPPPWPATTAPPNSNAAWTSCSPGSPPPSPRQAKPARPRQHSPPPADPPRADLKQAGRSPCSQGHSSYSLVTSPLAPSSLTAPVSVRRSVNEMPGSQRRRCPALRVAQHIDQHAHRGRGRKASAPWLDGRMLQATPGRCAARRR